MVSNKRRDFGDRSSIDLEHPQEIRYMQYKFPWFTRAEIVQAIKDHGPDRDHVIRYLEQKGKAGKTKTT